MTDLSAEVTALPDRSLLVLDDALSAVDTDTEAINGDKGAGAQGGGTIFTLDANGNQVRSQAGDVDAVNHYQVSDLFANDFAELQGRVTRLENGPPWP